MEPRTERYHNKIPRQNDSFDNKIEEQQTNKTRSKQRKKKLSIWPLNYALAYDVNT